MYVQEKILGEEFLGEKYMGEKSVQEEPVARLGEVFFANKVSLGGLGQSAPNGSKIGKLDGKLDDGWPESVGRGAESSSAVSMATLYYKTIY